MVRHDDEKRNPVVRAFRVGATVAVVRHDRHPVPLSPSMSFLVEPKLRRILGAAAGYSPDAMVALLLPHAIFGNLHAFGSL